MAGQQWEYASILVTAWQTGITVPGTAGPISRLVVAGTTRDLPTFDQTTESAAVLDYLDKAGAEGWEFAGVVETGERLWTFFFKRLKDWASEDRLSQ